MFPPASLLCVMVLQSCGWRGSDLQAGGWEMRADGPSTPRLNLWSSLFSFKLHRWALELLPGPPFIISPGLVETKAPLMMPLLRLICAAQSTRENVWLEKRSHTEWYRAFRAASLKQSRMASALPSLETSVHMGRETEWESVCDCGRKWSL